MSSEKDGKQQSIAPRPLFSITISNVDVFLGHKNIKFQNKNTKKTIFVVSLQ
jgi:hypothetical protein